MSITGSWWNQIRINVPEYSRYDGLNAEWQIDSYDENADTLSLTSASLGDYTNTNVRWSDIYLDNSNARFTLAKAVGSSPVDITGPFSFDLTQPYSISGTNLSLVQEIKKGATYNTILVDSGASLINYGYLLFQYGYNECTGPVRCLGNTDDSTLMIDPSFKFPFSLKVEHAKEIINVACDNWKAKLADKWAVSIVLDKEINVDKVFYDQMRTACTKEQHILFDNILAKIK